MKTARVLMAIGSWDGRAGTAVRLQFMKHVLSHVGLKSMKSNIRPRV